MATMTADVEKQVNALFLEYFNINILELEFASKNFFSDAIGLCSSELFAFIFKLEEFFNVHLEQDELLTDNVYTLNGISKLVAQKI